jgi:TetR/AcrR family tetracycline transcriptional repressor
VAGPELRGRRRPLSREAVVEAAAQIVEAEGLPALTMRHLADKLGVAVTSIYWHVGNRAALLDQLAARVVAEIGDIHPEGATPAERIVSVATSLRSRLLARPELVWVVHEQGRTPAMFQPAQAALATELGALGLRGRRAATAVQVIQAHVVGSVLLERTVSRSRVDEVTDPAAWGDQPEADREMVQALSGPLDHEAVFRAGLEAIVASLGP